MRALQLPAFRRGHSDRGITVFVVMVVLGTLLVAGVLLIQRSTLLLRVEGIRAASHRAYSCAETGLSFGRAYFGQNRARFSEFLQTGFVLRGPCGPRPSDPQFAVTLRDNLDELPPLANDPLVDRDGTVILVSTYEGEQSYTLRQFLLPTP